MHAHSANPDQAPDGPLLDIAEYLVAPPDFGAEAYDTARLCLLDALGCAALALTYPACAARLGPAVPGTIVPHGARVPGTAYELDPVKAAFNIGAAIRWLDFNDTWLAAEWGHPSDNLGAILAVADWRGRARAAAGGAPPLMRDVLTAMVQAYEVQGLWALENSLNRVGLDHVLLVRVASAAVATRLLGGGRDEIVAAVSNAWLDGGALRAYRHAPNTGARKGWAAGDATSRGVRLALLAMRGEMAYPTALSAPRWGVYDVLFGGRPFAFPRPYGAYVIENILFKIAYPAEFHAQTAVEAAVALHPQVRDRLDAIAEVAIATHESAIRIIDKRGPLHNPADRDHCLQYMAAIGLIFGDLTAAHYEDAVAADPRIDALRAKMTVAEEPRFSRDYLDPEKRAIANTVQVRFRDGTATAPVTVEYPLGHRRRREEAIPLLIAKAAANLRAVFPPDRADAIVALCLDRARLAATPTHDFMTALAR